MSEDPFEYYHSRSDFLLEIARQVEKLIHEYPSNIERFQQQVEVFVIKCENYLKGVESTEHNPPYLLAPVLSEQDRSQLPSPPNKHALLPDHYFLLTLIHDNKLKSPQFVPINNGIFSMKEDWVKCCWDYYRPRAEDGQEKALIETALDHVTTNLAKKPAETKQENKDAKREREGMILPKPPEIFQKILWIKKYGRKHWKLVSLAILIVLCIWILSKINLFS